MTEQTIFCGCSNSNCAIKLRAEWRSNDIAVTIWDGVGAVDEHTFTYADWIAHLEALDNYPLDDDKNDVYYYEFMTPMWSVRGGTTTFHLLDTNRNNLIARTKEMANVHGITL